MCVFFLISLFNRPLLKEHINIYLYICQYKPKGVQLSGFSWSIRMFSGRSGSRNYRIRWGWGFGWGRCKPDWHFMCPLLTFYRVFLLTILREGWRCPSFRRRGARGRCGVWRSKYLFLKKHITLCIFRVGVQISWPPPPPLYGFIILKSRESVETIDALQIKGFKLIHVSVIVLMLCSGQNISIPKANNFYIMQKRVMVLVICTSPHRVLNTIEVSSWYILYM